MVHILYPPSPWHTASVARGCCTNFKLAHNFQYFFSASKKFKSWCYFFNNKESSYIYALIMDSYSVKKLGFIYKLKFIWMSESKFLLICQTIYFKDLPLWLGQFTLKPCSLSLILKVEWVFLVNSRLVYLIVFLVMSKYSP